MIVPNHIDAAADLDCSNKMLATAIVTVTSSWPIYNSKFDLRLRNFHMVFELDGNRDNSHLHTTFHPRATVAFLHLQTALNFVKR